MDKGKLYQSTGRSILNYADKKRIIYSNSICHYYCFMPDEYDGLLLLKGVFLKMQIRHSIGQNSKAPKGSIIDALKTFKLKVIAGYCTSKKTGVSDQDNTF